MHRGVTIQFGSIFNIHCFDFELFEMDSPIDKEA
jgi:hypothetical protein